MDQDFANKVKRKQKRKLGLILLIVALLAAVIFVPVLNRNRDGRPIVTLEIRCDELSEDTSRLKDQSLIAYVPPDGTILAEEQVQAKSGDSVFDVLDKVCQEKDIQIEYSYTAAYDSYYVKGINYLYEFAGGKYSGWTYQVNGESPQVGCSKYTLKGNEKIVWNYTCGLNGANDK